MAKSKRSPDVLPSATAAVVYEQANDALDLLSVVEDVLTHYDGDHNPVHALRHVCQAIREKLEPMHEALAKDAAAGGGR